MTSSSKTPALTSPLLTEPCCPGCGGTDFLDGPLLTGQPVMLNYRCVTDEEARDLGKGAIQLRECQSCGLVFNATFDLNLIRYDAAYDNRQGFSEVFRTHLESVADRLLDHLPNGGKVLEVGCGKGEFLRLLRDRGCIRCVGYDTSCPDVLTEADNQIEYHRSYVTPDNVSENFDLIVCRHVVEHVPEIGAFLASLAGIARAAGDATVVIETPDFGWIVRNCCFWDYFYEHSNYFTFEALEELCRRAGLEVISHQLVFGEQYQLIIAKPASPPPQTAVAVGLLTRFIELTAQAQDRLEACIQAGRNGGSWAIWGAGAKGVTLASRLRIPGLEFVIDSNPDKVGCRLPGSAKPVISPSDPRVAGLFLIVIANPMYEAEILQNLNDSGFKGKILTV